jgi:DNA-binding transcriptional MerR regulator
MTEIQKMKDLGNSISELRKLIDEKTEDLKPLKEKKEKLQDELMLMLRVNEIKSIKDTDGTNFILSSRKGVSVTDEAKAMVYAESIGATQIDKTKLKKWLQSSDELPEGFEHSEQEYISIRKPKTDK